MGGAYISFSKAQQTPGSFAGVLLQLVTPNASAVNPGMYSGFIIYPSSIAFEIGIKFIIMNLIWFPIHLFWLFLGTYLKSLNLPSKLQIKINFLMAVALVIVVFLAHFTSLSCSKVSYEGFIKHTKQSFLLNIFFLNLFFYQLIKK